MTDKTEYPITLPAGCSFLHDEFNQAPVLERLQLAWRWLCNGYPRFAWKVLRGKVTADNLSRAAISLALTRWGYPRLAFMMGATS